MTALEAVVAVLAVARLVRLIGYDAWPLGAVRDSLDPDCWVARLLDCPWCLSMWVAPVWMVAWLILPGPVTIIGLCLAASLVAGALGETFGHGREP